MVRLSTWMGDRPDNNNSNNNNNANNMNKNRRRGLGLCPYNSLLYKLVLTSAGV